MSPDDMADYHGHMKDWCWEKHKATEGLMGAHWRHRCNEHQESARYWREKARENG